MLRAALWVLGGALSASGLAWFFRLLGVRVPALAPLADPALALWVAGFLLGVRAHARGLGRSRACWALLLANPFAWITLFGFLVGLLGLLTAGSPDPMGLGLAIAGVGALFFGFFLLWIAGACLALAHPATTALYGGLSGLLLSRLGDLVPEAGGAGALLGAILCLLERPASPRPGGSPRAHRS